MYPNPACAQALACLFYTCGRLYHAPPDAALADACARALELHRTFNPLQISQALQGLTGMGGRGRIPGAMPVYEALLKQARARAPPVTCGLPDIG